MKKYNLFSFVVKYMGFLKSIPLAPHLFDSLLKLHTLITKPELFDWLDEIESEVLSWKDTNTGAHKYGGLQFNHQDKEIGHVHSNGLLDILYTRKIKLHLLEKGRILPHHVFDNTGWISFYIRSSEDKDYAKELLRISYERS